MKSTTCSVYEASYQGFKLEVTETRREGGPLMPLEYMVFVGYEIVQDELESLNEAILVGHARIDQCVKVMNAGTLEDL